jgi:hypothetical protein
MALTPDALEYRETPVVNPDFVVVQMDAAAAAEPLFADNGAHEGLLTKVDEVGAGLGTPRTYPAIPIGILISANTVAVQILTENNSVNVATGINIPVGQSLYLPIQEASVSTIQYICSATVSVACFYAA